MLIALLMDFFPSSEDICSPNNTIIMCPQCDKHCDFWRLSETCIYSRISHLFDNNTTVAFACLMSLWGKYILPSPLIYSIVCLFGMKYIVIK